VNFTGIWIPVEILAVDEFSPAEQILLAQIKALSKDRECEATNEELAAWTRLSPNYISATLAKLKKAGYLSVEVNQRWERKRRISYTEILYSLLRNSLELYRNSLQALTKNVTGSNEIHNSLQRNSLEALTNFVTPLYKEESKEENKVESKTENTAANAASREEHPFGGQTAEGFQNSVEAGHTQQTAPTEKKKTAARAKPDAAPPKTAYRERVTLTEAEHQKLFEQYGEEFRERCYDKLDAYKGSTGKTYKSDYLTILNWVAQEVAKTLKAAPGQKKPAPVVPAYDPNQPVWTPDGDLWGEYSESYKQELREQWRRFPHMMPIHLRTPATA
jgi:DNA-binding MarR family transcriptional regulator